MPDEPARVSYRISDLPESERPRERLISAGADKLSEAELLAILVRVGVQGQSAVQLGQHLLQMFGGLSGIHRAPFEDLVAVKGIGQAKAAQIKAAIELGRRLQSSPPEEHATISNPAQAADLVKYDMQALEYEVLRVILMDTRNQVLEVQEVYRGSVNTAQVRARGCLQARRAEERHRPDRRPQPPQRRPNPQPGRRGRNARELIKAGELIDVKVLDHIIIGRGRHVSMKERGLGFA